MNQDVLLNLGCGNMPLPKPWKNIDKYYYPSTDEYPSTEEMNRADGDPKDFDWEKGDFTDLSKWEDNSVDKVNICHALEHVCYVDAMKTLGEIYRVLKPGGETQVEVPDLETIFKNFAFGNFNFMEMIDLVYGGRDGNVYNLGHFCGFTRLQLFDLMNDIGFRNLSFIEVGFGTSHPEPDRNFRLRGVK